MTKDEIENRVKEIDIEISKLSIVMNGIKIAANGIFGKLGERFSRIYSPQLLLQVTITGQLALLMLIERIEAIGVPVVSGNTDGIILKYPKARKQEVMEAIGLWESDTQFETEETKYKAVYSRDVNNYIAIKYEQDETAEFLDDRLGVKTKGCFAERGSALNSVLSKNPENLIVNDSVIRYLVDKTPVNETIKNCKDFRRFVRIRTVKGGGCKGDEYLGKIARWYYAENETEAINYVLSGNKVANTEGAKPAMDLPDSIPSDINYKYYIKEANEILYKLQAKQNPREMSLFD